MANTKKLTSEQRKEVEAMLVQAKEEAVEKALNALGLTRRGQAIFPGITRGPGFGE